MNIEYSDETAGGFQKPSGLPEEARVKKIYLETNIDFSLLVVPTQVDADGSVDSGWDGIIDKASAWVVRNQSEKADTIPSVTVPLYGCFIAWSTERASIVGPASRLDLLEKAVVEFSQCAFQLMCLEQTCQELLRELDGDARHAFEFEENDTHRSHLAKKFHVSVSVRMKLALLAPAIHAPPVYPPTIASQLSERLRDRTRLADRHEFTVDRAEILGQFYEACGQRVTESGIARRQMGLEWAIIILLILQTAILVIDILSASGSS